MSQLFLQDGNEITVYGEKYFSHLILNSTSAIKTQHVYLNMNSA